MSPGASPSDGRVRTPRSAASGRTTSARRAGIAVLEPPPSGTEWGRLRGGGRTTPEGPGAGAAGRTTEAARGGAHQSAGIEPLRSCGLNQWDGKGAPARCARAEPWGGGGGAARALRSVGAVPLRGCGSCSSSVFRAVGGCCRGSCTKCGPGSAVWVIPLRCWGGHPESVEERCIKGGGL